MRQGYIVLNEIFYNFVKKHKNIIKKKKLKDGIPVPIPLITITNLPNNNFMNSICTSYIINSLFTGIPIYFWKSTDDVNLNLAIKNVLLNQNTIALDWPDNYKNQAVNAANNFYDLLSFENIVVDNYSDGFIICVLGKQFDFYGAAYGPYYVYFAPVYYDDSIILFINNATTTNRNIAFNGFMYYILLQQFGRCFGLVSPEEQIGGSILMPGMVPLTTSIGYQNQNTVFNTVMSNNYVNFYLPCEYVKTNYAIGYPSNLQPLDLVSSSWLYGSLEYPEGYGEKYSVKVINPTTEQQNLIKCIIGPDRSITFGNNNSRVSFYLNYYDAEQIIFNSNEIFPYAYNRAIVKPYGFYNMDINATIANLTFNNRFQANLFIGYNGNKIDLTVNINCQETNIYFNQSYKDFKIDETFRNIFNTLTEKTITLVFTVYNKVKLIFNDNAYII